jgi:GTPase
MPETNPRPSKLPPGTQEAARIIWDSLSPADRRALQDLIEAFPSQTSMIQLLMRLAGGQIKTAFGQKRRVVIVGPANVGKSTLYNQLIQNKKDRAEVSPVPGTTRQNQQADTGLFTVVDTPGADTAGDLGQREREYALTAAEQADFLIIVFDAVQGIKRSEMELYERLIAMKKPYVVLMNKIDLVRRDKQKVLESAAASLRLQPDQLIPVVAETGENLDDVLVSIAMIEPEIVAALGQALPQYRWQLAWRSIVSTASASAVIALTPIPFLDFIPLVATQSVMVLSIARIYNYHMNLERARELVATFGMGFLGRMLFQQLSKLGGVPGWILAAAIAASTTVVMGYAASVWFETGERLSNQTLKNMTRALTTTLINSLRNFGKRRPGKETLKEQIEEALKEMPLGKDRTPLDQQAQEAAAAPDDPTDPPSL